MEKVLTKYLSAHTQKDYAFIDWSTMFEGANTVSEGNDSMILNCTDTSGCRGYGFYLFPCSPGAIVEASAWVKDTDTSSPHNARVAIDFSSPNLNETVYEGTTSKNMWEHVKVIGIAPATTMWSRTTFGYWPDTYGSCEIRDIVIKIYNNNDTPLVPTIKTAVIRKVDALVGWEIDSRFINTGIASVSDEGTYLLITYSNPFSSSYPRPSAFIGEEYFESSHAYKVKASYSMAKTCKVSFYSEANNTLVNPADVDAAVYFNFLAIGW